MNEIWKSVAEFDGVFEISSLGRVRRLKSTGLHFLTPTKNHRGYLRVCLCYKNKNYARSVHILVADAFLDKKDSLHVVNHIDGNKLNNSILNLERTTQKNNHLHALSLEVTQRCKYPRGAYQRTYKLKDGRTKKVWYSQIVFKNKRKKLGVFNNKLDAQLAFKKAFESLYGFPPWRSNV